MKPSPFSSRGGVLIVVLAFILVVGALVSGWITVMSSQSGYVDEISSGVQRRIALNNATALARQYLLANLLTKSASAAAVADVGGGWGSVSIPASNSAPLSTFQKSGGYNHFSPGGGEGYSLDIPVTMTAGTASASRLFQLRSGSSILSGTLTVLNSPATTITGSLGSSGRALLWLPEGPFSLTSTGYAVPTQPASALQGTSGEIAPSNFPFVPLTGSETASAPSFNGILDVIANPSGINSLAVMASTSAPNGSRTISDTSTSSNVNGVQIDNITGTVNITLMNPNLGNVVISGGMSHLILTGQTTTADRTSAGNAPAILILVNQTTVLTDVTFSNSNYRKVVLAIKTASGAATTFIFSGAGGLSWRSVIVLETTPVTFNLSGATQPLEGGIQSDRTIAISSGTLNISPEPDPKLLERLCPRDGWLEAYSTP